ncbi:MAG TPA: hypothetical protein VF643_11645 [Sphingomonas sp.]|jgi:hypothetical protein
MILTVPLVLAGCVPPARVPAPEPVRAPPVIAPPAPQSRSADWRDWQVTPGVWSYARDARGSIALFGMPGADARLTLRCDVAAQRLYLSRQGAVAAPLTIRTSTATRSLAAQQTGGQPAYIATALAPGDPLLDAIAFSRGRFVVEQAAVPALVVPAWAEIGRVIEDCRG